MSAPAGTIERGPSTALDTWAVVEMLGFKKLAGHISEHVMGSVVFIRLDVPETRLNEDTVAQEYTKYIGPGSIYCITPCSEEIARLAAQQLAAYNPPIPVALPARLSASVVEEDVDSDDDDVSDHELPL